MSEIPAKPDPNEDQPQVRAARLYLLAELLVIVVFVAALLLLMQNYRPRTFIGRGLVELRLWVLVLFVSALGTSVSLIPYYLGQRGTKVIFERYPKLEGRPWQRLEAAFQKWGAFTLILSGIPGVGTALLVAGGAFGIKRRGYLCWVFVGKVLRYWVVTFAVLLSLQLLD
jgi:membrane protein YqaA with SNARE-associated domain